MTLKTQQSVNKPIFFIDFLRCSAAFAVVIIHVLGPFRKLYGDIPESEWLAAITFNSLTRWAVPIFMMITGALLLSPKTPFCYDHYLKKRLKKVVIPFIAWTFIYALVGSLPVHLEQWNIEDFLTIIVASPTDPTWYHLWFFYDFIPLYILLPFLYLLLVKLPREHIKLLLLAYLLLFSMKWLGVKSVILINIVLYSGYLVLGWFLVQRDNSKIFNPLIIAGCSMLALNIWGTWYIADTQGRYSSFYMGYKSLNTAVIAAMIFVAAQQYAEKISGQLRRFITYASRYSFGIFLIHPLILLPVRNLDNGLYLFWGSNWLAIPAISVIVFILSLLATIVFVKIPGIRQLVP